MILPTMSDSEIVSNLNDDYRLINSRYMERLFNEYDRIRHRNHIDKKLEFSRCFEFRTPQKNNWIYILSKAPSDNTYKGLNSIVGCLLCYYFDDIGVRAFKVNPSAGITAYNTGFFNQYSNRMNLNLINPADKVKHYFTHNSNTIQAFKENGDGFDVVGLVKDGFILGNVKEGDYYILYNTFISRDLENVEQEEFGRNMMSLLLGMIEAELKKGDFDREKYEYMADIYKSLVA